MPDRDRITKLNDLLRSELGYAPLYQWKHYLELFTHVAKINDDGGAVLDYVCACGVNIIVHSPGCKMSVAAARPFVINTAPNHPGAFIICSLQLPVPEPVFRRQHGCLMPYPRSGVWIPTGIRTEEGGVGTAAMPPDEPPTESDTWWFIRAVRSRPDLIDIANEFEYQEQKRWQDIESNADYAFRDVMGRGTIPGTKGAVSYPLDAFVSKSEKGKICLQ